MQNTSFNHSVKVPRLYKCAAKISQEVAGGGGSIKQLVYEKTHFNTKALYALVVTTFQKANEIDLLLKRTKLLEKEPRLDPWLAKILISEILWGKRQLPNRDAKPIQTILAYEQAFHAHLSDSSRDTTAEKPENFKKPRYVRINTLINPFNEALELFEDEGWTLQTHNNENDYENFLKQVRHLEGDFMLKDLHIPDLLIFPGGTEFYNHPGYKKGALVLQDKASCLPVHLLSPPPGSVVLDMCAAPGMKTTQLATMIQNEGTIYAVERDPKRFEVLNKMVESSGATCVKTVHRDVLECGSTNFPNVEYVLVDPSCSASGMTDRLEIQQNRDQSRLQKLAGFQIKILRSALTRYPKAKKVVYSTCSLYPEENEDVVRQVLETNNQFKLVPASESINNIWKNFGSSDFGDIGKYCMYARPEEDMTNGFYVAVFERLQDGETNEFFNGRVLNYRKNVEQKQARKERKNKKIMEGGDDLKKSDEDKMKDKKLPDIGLNKDDEKISGIVKVSDGNMTDKDRTNKRRNSDVNTLVQSTGNEFSKKRKKKKNLQGEVNNLTQNVEESQELANASAENEESYELLKKSKRKKRKQVENITETTQLDDVMSGDLNETTLKENKEKKKNKKRKRKFIDKDENLEQIINKNDDEINFENTNQNVLHKKEKKKKSKHSEYLNKTHQETQNIITGVEGQDTESSDLNVVGVEDIKIRKSKKKERRKEKDEILTETCMEEQEPKENFENTNRDVADGIINKLLKRNKKKKARHTFDGQLMEYKDEYQHEIHDDSLIKNKNKKRHDTLDDTN